MKLPTWEELYRKVEAREPLSSFEQFLYDHEPDYEDKPSFRNDLQSLMNETKGGKENGNT